MVELADSPRTLVASGASDPALSRTRLRMAAVCMVGVAFGASILPFCAVSAALGPMMLEFGWSADHVSLASAILMWAAALCIWPMGVLIDRLGARPVVSVAAAAIGAISLLLPQAQHFWQICVLLALLGACSSCGLGYSRMIVSLFGSRRGVALGILAALSATISQVMPTAMAGLFTADGWRGAFTLLGFAVLALAPIIYLGLTERWSTAVWPPRMPRPVAVDGTSAREATRERSFWIIVAASVAVSAMGGGISAVFPAVISAKGFGQAPMFNAAPILLAAVLGGALCTGALLDRNRSPKFAAALYLAPALTYLLWTVATPSFGGQAMLVAGQAVGAFAYTAQLTLIAYCLSRYFGLRSFATLYGLQLCLQEAATGVAAPLIGLSVGAGHYQWMFVLGIGAQVLAAGLFLTLPAFRFAAIGEADAPPDDVLAARVQT